MRRIELIERRGKYWVGFFPMYWDDGYDGGWQWIRFDIKKDKAEQLMRSWVLGAEQKNRYRTSKTIVVKSVVV